MESERRWLIPDVHPCTTWTNPSDPDNKFFLEKNDSMLHLNEICKLIRTTVKFLRGPFSRYIWILIFCSVILTKAFGTYLDDEKKQPVDSSSITVNNTEQGVEKVIVQSVNRLIHERWFYYINMLALTITAGSTLLFALVIVKLQSLSNSLISIERSIVDAFSRRGKLNDYSKHALKHSIDERWSDYFDAVGKLSEEFKNIFVPPSQNTSFINTKAFVDSLVEQGRSLQKRNERLQIWIRSLFLVTATLSGIAVLILPAAPWISENLLIKVWIGSGLIFFVIFVFFLRIVYVTLPGRHK